MIGAPIGAAIGEPYPYSSTFVQAITVNVGASSSVRLGVGKILSISLTFASSLLAVASRGGALFRPRVGNRLRTFWKGRS